MALEKTGNTGMSGFKPFIIILAALTALIIVFKIVISLIM